MVLLTKRQKTLWHLTHNGNVDVTSFSVTPYGGTLKGLTLSHIHCAFGVLRDLTP
jgi:hypothetical protein